MEFNCTDRDCFVENKLQSICIVYIPDSGPNCSIPCSLENCAHRILREVLCPIYHCTPFTTAATTTTTTASVPPSDVNGWNIASYSFNAILVFMGLILFYIFYKKWIKAKNQQRDAEQVQLLHDQPPRFDQRVRFSIRGDRSQSFVRFLRTNSERQESSSGLSKKKSNDFHKKSFEIFVN